MKVKSEYPSRRAKLSQLYRTRATSCMTNRSHDGRSVTTSQIRLTPCAREHSTNNKTKRGTSTVKCFLATMICGIGRSIKKLYSNLPLKNRSHPLSRDVHRNPALTVPSHVPLTSLPPRLIPAPAHKSSVRSKSKLRSRASLQWCKPASLITAVWNDVKLRTDINVQSENS